MHSDISKELYSLTEEIINGRRLSKDDDISVLKCASVEDQTD